MTADVISYPRSAPGGGLLVLAVAAFFLCMSVYALFKPAAIVERFGMTADTADARAEIRAVYGGFGIAMAVLLAVALGQPSQTRNPILITIAVATLGMALGRATRVFDRGRTAFNPSWLFLLVELALTAALFGAVALD